MPVETAEIVKMLEQYPHYTNLSVPDFSSLTLISPGLYRRKLDQAFAELTPNQPTENNHSISVSPQTWQNFSDELLSYWLEFAKQYTWRLREENKRSLSVVRDGEAQFIAMVNTDYDETLAEMKVDHPLVSHKFTIAMIRDQIDESRGQPKAKSEIRQDPADSPYLIYQVNFKNNGISKISRTIYLEDSLDKLPNIKTSEEHDYSYWCSWLNRLKST